MRETWYVLEDGSFADPAEVAPDSAGMLRHKSGVGVAYGPHGPKSRSMGPEERAAAAGPKGSANKRAAPKWADREMKAKPGAGYETR